MFAKNRVPGLKSFEMFDENTFSLITTNRSHGDVHRMTVQANQVLQSAADPGSSHGCQSLWQSETPHNTSKLCRQARLIKDILQRQSHRPLSQALQ
jgi:hypothetical protein